MTPDDDEKLIDRLYQRGRLIDRLDTKLADVAASLVCHSKQIKTLETIVARQTKTLERALFAVNDPDGYVKMRRDERDKAESNDNREV